MMMRDVKDGVWPSTQRRRAAERNRKVWRFVLTILATVTVMQGLIEMIPQGGWLNLANYTAGVIALTLLTQDILNKTKRIK